MARVQANFAELHPFGVRTILKPQESAEKGVSAVTVS